MSSRCSTPNRRWSVVGVVVAVGVVAGGGSAGGGSVGDGVSIPGAVVVAVCCA